MRRALLVVLALAVLLGGLGTAVVLRSSEPGPTPLPTSTGTPVRIPLFAPAAIGAPASAAGLQRTLAMALRDRRLGGRLALSVLDATTGASILELGASRLSTPASTAKIVTAVAALTVLEPEQRFATRVLQSAPGEVVLVGGGDPLLTRAQLVTLAIGLKDITRVVVDDTLFTGPRTGPGWKPGYVSHGNVAPVSALALEEGRLSDAPGSARSADPALEAGRALAKLVKARVVVRGKAPAQATELAKVLSLPVAALVEQMLSRSDNDLAEALGRHVALASRQPATFAGEAVALRAAVSTLSPGDGVQLLDASGLSPQNLLRPAALTRLLAAVVANPRYASVLTGLPVAGFDGTLEERFRNGAGAGEIRAKTGTLNGVSALAGLVRTADGRLLVFALTVDGLAAGATLGAQAALDRIATALAACGCR